MTYVTIAKRMGICGWEEQSPYLPCSRVLGSCDESINLDSAFSLPPLVHPPVVHPHFCGSLSFLEDPEPLAGCRAWSCFHINVNTPKCPVLVWRIPFLCLSEYLKAAILKCPLRGSLFCGSSLNVRRTVLFVAFPFFSHNDFSHVVCYCKIYLRVSCLLQESHVCPEFWRCHS